MNCTEPPVGSPESTIVRVGPHRDCARGRKAGRQASTPDPRPADAMVRGAAGWAAAIALRAGRIAATRFTPIGPAAAALAVAGIVAVLTAACGGGAASPAAPTTGTTPTPSPTPGSAACAAIGSVAAMRPEIVNGTACSPSTSSVVLVNLRDAGGSPSGSCSGTVVAPRAVLTAAHCLDGDTASARVFPGSGDVVDSVSVHIHPRYREEDSSSPDVGVVLTAQDIPRSAVPVLLGRDAVVGEQAVIAGWGKDEFGNGTTLRAATTVVAAVFANYLETRVAATGSGVCSGDSGGPILLSEGGVWAVAGVTSAGSFGGSCIEGSNYFTSIRYPDVRSFIAGLVPDLTSK